MRLAIVVSRRSLAFQSQLGRPWFEVFGCPFNLPPAFLLVVVRLRCVCPRRLRRGRLYSRLRRDRRLVVAVAMSVWWAREMKARPHLWPHPMGREARSSSEAGLLGNDSVLIGRWRAVRRPPRRVGPHPTLLTCLWRAASQRGCVVREHDGSRYPRGVAPCRALSIRPDSAFLPIYTIGQGRCRAPTLSARRAHSRSAK